ncbi:MAG: PepSY domain-containing protein [Thiotrichales bacterium]
MSTSLASAESGQGSPAAEFIVEDVVVAEQLPDEVTSASIKVDHVDDEAFAGLAKISITKAIEVAQAVVPGTIVEAKLDEENDFLIWEVEIIDKNSQEIQLKIDAGNARLLAAENEREEEEAHWWKFWDRDEHKDQAG